MSDNVNHPEHYKVSTVTVSIEPIEISARISSCLGQAFQYIVRSPYKGHTTEDLRKAIFYLNKWLDLYKEEGGELLSSEAKAYSLLYTKEMSKQKPNAYTTRFLNILFESQWSCVEPKNVVNTINAIQQFIK